MRKILGWLTLSIIILIVAAFIAIQIPAVQVKIANYAAEKLSIALNTKISIDKFKVKFNGTIALDGLYAEDLHQDTLLYVKHLDAKLAGFYLNFQRIVFDHVSLNEAVFNLRQYPGEEDLNIQFILDALKSDGTTLSESPATALFFWKVDLENTRFRFNSKDDGQAPLLEEMDYEDLDIYEISGQLNQFSLIEDSIFGNIQNIKCKEKCGVTLHDLNADFTIAPTLMYFDNLKARVENSKFEGKFNFDYEGFDELSNFIEDVFIRAIIKSSKINLHDLRFFAPELRGLEQLIDLSGNLIGTIENLRGKGVKMYYGNHTKFAGNFNISGLPDINDTYFNFHFDELKTNAEDLKQIQSYPFAAGNKLEIPEIVDQFGTIIYRGKLIGFIDDFVTEGNIFSQLGKAATDLRLSFNPAIDDYEYSGKLFTESFNLGKLLKEEPLLGLVSCNIDLTGKYFDIDQMDVELNGDIGNIDINGYNYKNLTVIGLLEKRKFNGTLNINDKNLVLNFLGEINLRMTIPEFNFNADIIHANLFALNLFKIDSVFTISTNISSNFTGKDIDDLEGEIYIEYSEINYASKNYLINKISLESSGNQYNKRLKLNSDILNAEIEGRFKLLELEESAKKILNTFLPSFTMFDVKKITKDPFNQNFNYNIDIKDIDLLSDLFFPLITIAPNSKLKGEFSSNNNKISTYSSAPKLKIAKYTLNNFYINATSTANALELAAGASSFELSDSISLFKPRLEAKAMRDSIGYVFNWSNNSKLEQEGELNGNIYFSGTELAMHILPSYILIKDQLWIVSEENEIAINGNNIHIDDLAFSNNNQFIRIDGDISNNENDELDIILDNFELNNINAFLPMDDIQFKGIAKGIISFSNLYNKPFFKSNLELLKFNINDILLGNGQIESRWDNKLSRFIVDASLRRDTLRTFRAIGFYDPNNEKNALNLQVSLRNIQMRLLQPLLSDIFSEVDGFLSGNLNILGNVEKPEITGTLNVNKGKVLVEYLNTAYTFSHNIEVSKNKISISDMTIYDARANTGKVNFSLNHNYFSNFTIDLLVNLNKLQTLNTVETQNDLFYGTAYASGSFSAKGDFDNIKMNIAAKTERGTTFNLPLFGAEEINQDNFINFIDSRNPKPLAFKKKKKLDPKGFEMNFSLEVTPDAEALLIFDPQVGDLIKGRGRGNLRMVVTEAGEFLLFGEYMITQGEYLFTLQNVINKRFEVESGGTIVWKGDPIDADINLKAIYNTRTSLYELVKEIDTSDVYKRKTDVQAMLIMSDKLLNPTIAFDIRFPSSDENTRNLAMSQIPNEDEMSKQVIGLLLFNQFFPVSGGIGEGRNSGVGSNASELLSNQLSNWLSKLSDNVDIGVNYRSGDQQSADEITVQLSTQISDRITFDGNFGQMSSVNNPQSTNLVGEFNVEIRITDDGKLRLKFFNRSNQYILITNDVPYTQGVGLFYRREFDNFSELTRSNKKLNKKVNTSIITE